MRTCIISSGVYVAPSDPDDDLAVRRE